MVTTDDISSSSDDVRRVLYVLMASGEGGGSSVRAAQHAQNEEVAEFLREIQDEFAERAARRLESVADRLEQQSTRFGVEDSETLARAQEMRVAAFMVRDEAQAVVRRAALGSLELGASPCEKPWSETEADSELDDKGPIAR